MLYLSKVYSGEEGLITVQLDIEGSVMLVRDQDLHYRKHSLDASREEVGSETISDLLSVFEQTREKDIVVMPMPTTFTFVDREFEYSGTLEAIYLGYGYLYSHHNQYVFLSNDVLHHFKVSRELPCNIEGAVVKEYHKYMATYLIEADNGSRFIIPYWILETGSFKDNPLIHFPPFRLIREHDLPEGLEFEMLEGRDEEVALETKQVGVSSHLYLRDKYGTYYYSQINHALLKNMSVYSKEIKLKAGLEALSPQGDYLKAVPAILKKVGVIYEKD